MKVRQYISYFLLLAALMMVMIPTIPHHHHAGGVVCMKDDLKENNCCANHHHHHHQSDDPCCTDNCPAHFDTTIATSDAEDVQPQYQYIVTLFTEPLLRLLYLQKDRNQYLDYAYIEPLHGTYITRAAGLRAPPCI